MQDVHPIGGGGARMFAGGGDRRMRPNHHHAAAETAAAAALKCPRCDSPNTKFCYYNNYNLSQPRHYCKSCRRYWTKGGVLRNVPVGGGCRKAKRSINHKKTTADEVGTTEVVSADPQPLMDQSTDGQIFQELGSFTNLIDLPDTYRLQRTHPEKGVENDDSKYQWGPQAKIDGEDGKIQEIVAAGFLEDAAQSRRSNGGLSSLDWQIGGAHGMFDLTGAVDQSYWNDDHALNYLP